MNDIVRELTEAEVTQWYLPLRMKAMHEELGWTNHPVSLPENLRDQFDRDAIQLGCFKATEFAGAIRLVLAECHRKLPSGPFMPNEYSFEGIAAELTKGIVYAQFRGCGVFRKLLEHSLNRAAAAGVVHLFLSAFDTDRERSFWALHGFAPIGETFDFSDEHISPRGRAILFYRRCTVLGPVGPASS